MAPADPVEPHPDEPGDQVDQREAVPVPTFQAPSPDPAPRRLPQDPIPEGTTRAKAAGSDGSAAASVDDESPKKGSTGSTKRFRPLGALDHATVAAYAKVAGVVFTAIGGLLNDRMAFDETDDVWLPDDMDVSNVAGPVGNIAARHAPIAGDSASDIGDALAAVAGLAVYMVGNLGKLRTRRRRARAAARGAAVAPPVDEQPPPVERDANSVTQSAPQPPTEGPVPTVDPGTLAALSGIGAGI
jgi:hypothetical protein